MQATNVLDYLGFQDWLERGQASPNNPWIVVAQSHPGEAWGLFTISALVLMKSGTIKRLLSRFEWEITTDFGGPTFERRGDEIHFNPDWQQSVRGFTLEPFTLYRHYHGLVPNRFELPQAFVLYHNLYWVSEQSAYNAAPSEECVARYRREGQRELVEVRTHALRDYLAARNMCLVRYHDHRRRGAASQIAVDGEDSSEAVFKSESAHFHLYVALRRARVGSPYGRLFGKDILLPFKEPRHEDYLYLRDGQKKNHVKFIIGTDPQTGDNIEEICDGDQLSNYFVDRGKVPYLTPVYFKPEVLQKYYGGPRRYTVEGGELRCLDLWSLTFAINEEGLVHAWLGDLGHLPYDEQLHCRAHNVVPSGGLNEAFYNSQILGEFAVGEGAEEDSVAGLKSLIGAVNDKWRLKFGFELFLPLSPGDDYIWRTLHIPLTDEQRELDEQIQYLAKLVNDSINKAEMVRVVPIGREEGSIAALRYFLQSHYHITPQLADGVVLPLRIVQTLRSTGSAHRKGSNYRKVLRELGLESLPQREVFQELIRGVGIVLAQILELAPLEGTPT